MSQWKVDPAHSEISFSVRHMVMSKVRGRFTQWSAEFAIDEGDFAKSTFSAAIKVASITSGVDDRDAHLRSPDFLDSDKFPELTYKSVRVEKLSDESYRVHGKLTIKDQTREVPLDVEFHGSGKDPWGNHRLGFSAVAEINRKDFGLTWNQVLETGGVLVGEKVNISIELQVIKQA